MSIRNLPGIKSIFIILADNFQGEMINGKMKLYCDFEELTLVGLAEFTTETSIKDGQTIYTTKGSFTLYDAKDVDIKYYNENSFAFLLTDVHGDSYVLGTEEKPYPILQLNRNIKSSTRNLSAELTYTSTNSLIPIC